MSYAQANAAIDSFKKFDFSAFKGSSSNRGLNCEALRNYVWGIPVENIFASFNPEDSPPPTSAVDSTPDLIGTPASSSSESTPTTRLTASARDRYLPKTTTILPLGRKFSGFRNRFRVRDSLLVRQEYWEFARDVVRVYEEGRTVTFNTTPAETLFLEDALCADPGGSGPLNPSSTGVASLVVSSSSHNLDDEDCTALPRNPFSADKMKKRHEDAGAVSLRGMSGVGEFRISETVAVLFDMILHRREISVSVLHPHLAHIGQVDHGLGGHRFNDVRLPCRRILQDLQSQVWRPRIWTLEGVAASGYVDSM